jgi:hypothetical protein
MSVSEGDVDLIDDFLMSTMTRAAEPLRADFERREPRCRICRDESVRVLVNKLLDGHGAPIILGGDKAHVVTYADILRDLEPLNEGRDKRDRITYDSLWVHAKRHYDHAAITAYWRARMHQELRNAYEDNWSPRRAEPIPSAISRVRSGSRRGNPI